MKADYDSAQGDGHWREYVRNDKGANFTERPRIALLLGAVIADGFIAVQAEDAPGERRPAPGRGGRAREGKVRHRPVEVSDVVDREIDPGEAGARA